MPCSPRSSPRSSSSALTRMPIVFRIIQKIRNAQGNATTPTETTPIS